jgi:RimJ/RimL family protein N-acetyltransferase
VVVVRQDRPAGSSCWLECRADVGHILHGDLVTLRPLHEGDLLDLVDAYDDALARGNHGYVDTPLDEVAEYSRQYIAHASLDPLVADLAMVDRHDPDGPVLGHVQLVATPVGDPSRLPVQLGFTVHRRARGRGLATEAVRLALRLATDHLGVATVWAETAPWNTGAIRVMTAAKMRRRPGELRALPDGRSISAVGFVSHGPGAVRCPQLLVLDAGAEMSHTARGALKDAPPGADGRGEQHGCSPPRRVNPPGGSLSSRRTSRHGG